MSEKLPSGVLENNALSIYDKSKVNSRHRYNFCKGRFLEMLHILQNVLQVKIPSNINVFFEPFDVA